MIAAFIGFVVVSVMLATLVAHLGLSMLTLVVVVQFVTALMVVQSLVEQRRVLFLLSSVVFVLASVRALGLML